MSIRFFDIEFTRNGSAYDESQVQRILHQVPELTDLIVISHGWNNDKDDAAKLYSKFFDSIARVMDIKIVDGFRSASLVRRAFTGRASDLPTRSSSPQAAPRPPRSETATCSRSCWNE